MYGGPPIDAGGSGTGGTLYGAPPVDASSGDAAQDRGIIALYGAAPAYGLSPTPGSER